MSQEIYRQSRSGYDILFTTGNGANLEAKTEPDTSLCYVRLNASGVCGMDIPTRLDPLIATGVMEAVEKEFRKHSRIEVSTDDLINGGKSLAHYLELNRNKKIHERIEEKKISATSSLA